MSENNFPMRFSSQNFSESWAYLYELISSSFTASLAVISQPQTDLIPVEEDFPGGAGERDLLRQVVECDVESSE